VVSLPFSEIMELMCSVSVDLYWFIDPYGLSLDVYSPFSRLSNFGR
jgi:hypothetical protein